MTDKSLSLSRSQIFEVHENREARNVSLCLTLFFFRRGASEFFFWHVVYPPSMCTFEEHLTSTCQSSFIHVYRSRLSTGLHWGLVKTICIMSHPSLLLVTLFVDLCWQLRAAKCFLTAQVNSVKTFAVAIPHPAFGPHEEAHPTRRAPLHYHLGQNDYQKDVIVFRIQKNRNIGN